MGRTASSIAPLLTVESIRWRASAVCLGKPTGWWYASDDSIETVRALRVCRRCPVRGECPADALANEPTKGDTHGVRGGVIATRRRSMI
jgi:hypothetical protein